VENSYHYDQTSVTGLGLAALCFSVMLVLMVKRENIIWPLMLIACFISFGQRINILGLDFTFLRILLLVATLRIVAKCEYKGFKLQTLDVVFILLLIARAVVYVLLHGSVGSAVYQSGVMYDALGAYFFCRLFFRDERDIIKFAKVMAIISIPVAVFFLVEWATGRNMFSAFGGVPLVSLVRSGRIRCQGAFSHPIMAGCFWVTALIYVSLLLDKRNNSMFLGVAGVFFTLLIIFTTASSTPVLAIAFGMLGAGLYYLRNHLVSLTAFCVFTLTCMHLAMRAPVWHLIGRIDVVGGSTGYHRYRLIDEFIKHAADWFLLGVKETGGWGYGLSDVTNQYVLEGITGGAIGLAFFLVLLFMLLNGLRKKALEEPDDYKRIIIWGVWTSLFMQAMIFFAVSYFGQMLLMWYVVLGFATSLIYYRGASSEGAKEIENLSIKNSQSAAGVNSPWISPGGARDGHNKGSAWMKK